MKKLKKIFCIVLFIMILLIFVPSLVKKYFIVRNMTYNSNGKSDYKYEYYDNDVYFSYKPSNWIFSEDALNISDVDDMKIDLANEENKIYVTIHCWENLFGRKEIGVSCYTITNDVNYQIMINEDGTINSDYYDGYDTTQYEIILKDNQDKISKLLNAYERWLDLR